MKITFRQLLEDLSSIAAVAKYLDEKMPADKFAPAPAAAPVVAKAASAPVHSRNACKAVSTCTADVSLLIRARQYAVDQRFAGATSVERLVKMQLQIMAQQLEALRGE